MAKTAFIFPGQGSQYAGMGKDLSDNFAIARETFQEADEALGFSISSLCFNGPEEELKLTSNTQPAILTASIAALRAIRQETGLEADASCVAGHSLGEYSALVCSGAISLADAVLTVRKRGAFMQEAVKLIIERAASSSKPVVIEKLDFSKKKATLEKEDPRHARMISSLSYSSIIEGINSRAYRHGIEVIEVNPAYSSIIGLITYAQKKGISVHQAPSLVIARRGCGLRERSIQGEATVPTPKGDHVTFTLPARNASKHVWSFWSDVRKLHKAVLAAHFRPPQGEPLTRRSKSKCPIFTVKPRNANRSQHCSVNVMDDIPW